MRLCHGLLICGLLIACRLEAQSLEPFGLEGKNVTALYYYGGSLYAAAENDGVYRRFLGAPDSGWVHLGVPAHQLTSIFVFHTVCPLVCWKGILTGNVLDPAQGDTALVYFFQQRPDTCTKKGQWATADSGIARNAITQINAVGGIDMCQPVGPTFVTAFAAAPTSLWKSEDRGKSWQRVFQASSITDFLTLMTKLRSPYIISNNEVWAGGSKQDNQGVQKVFILRSVDSGTHWEDRSPVATAADECRALALHPTDTSIVFAALNHSIIQSHDAGRNWASSTPPNQNVSFKALAINPQQPDHIVAGGTLDNDLFTLYESRDGGEHWNLVSASEPLKEISSLVFDPADDRHVYIATRGTGVFRYPRLGVRVKEEQRAPESFQLSAEFPNPFHLQTNQPMLLRVNLPAADRLTVRVFNVVGQEITNWQQRLAAGEQSVALPLDRVRLSAGVYLVQAEWRGQRVTRKFTVIF